MLNFGPFPLLPFLPRTRKREHGKLEIVALKTSGELAESIGQKDKESKRRLGTDPNKTNIFWP